MSRGFQPVYSPAPRRGAPRWPLALVGIGAAVVVGAVAIMVLSGNQPAASPRPTEVASSPAASAPVSVAPTEGSIAPEPTASAAPSATAGASPEATPSDASGPPASIDPTLAAQIEAVIEQMPAIRELEPTGEVPYQFIGRDQFRDDLLELYNEEVPVEVRNAEERLLKRLGLLPDDVSLDELIIELYGAQVAAFYRPDNGRFYIIERAARFGALERIIVAHEYTHALQDQHFDIEGTRITDLTQGDAALAQLAVLEGDATLASQRWAVQNLTREEALELLTDSLSELDDQSLADMPLVLRRQLEFPYTDGFAFVSDVWSRGGFEAVNEALMDPPDSTEQILHSDKYHAGEAPIVITLDDQSAALGNGWELTYEQTMGELGIQILAAGGEEPEMAIPGLPVEWPHAEAAAGWGGDRLHMYENGEQWAIVWRTEWDTGADTVEFMTRIAELLPTFDGLARAASSAAGPLDPDRDMPIVLVAASDQDTLDTLVRLVEFVGPL